jgi:hypothetical protein
MSAKALLRRLLAGAAVIGALLLALAAAGLLPAREPAEPAKQAFSVEGAVPPRRSPEGALPEPVADADAAAVALHVSPLCASSAKAVRLYEVALWSDEAALLVWCGNAYELFALRAAQASFELFRVARFAAHAEHAGGAAAGDFDGDGHMDLVLGVASPRGVAHRSGAGVFLVRGRAQGGFESAEIVAETSSVALAAFPRAQGAGHDLALLTAGDVAAQRPGELWLFTRESRLVRKAVAAVGVEPRGLALGPVTPERIEAWVLSARPGRLERLFIERAGPALSSESALSLPLRGAQSLAQGSFGGALFVRDATSVYRVQDGSEPALSAYAEGVRVGPFAVADFNRDQQPELLASLAQGVAYLEARGGSLVDHELTLGAEVLDVAVLRLGDRALPVALIRREQDALSLVQLPVPPWPRALPDIVLQTQETRELEGLAQVPLE